MPLRHLELKTDAYVALRNQIATAVALCSDEQVLDIADALHDTLRRRRASIGDHQRLAEPASFIAG